MRFVSRRPLRNRPERVHHSARPISELIREPPLSTKRSVGGCGKPLKISDPIVGPVRRFPVRRVSGFCIVKRFDRGEPGAVAIAALIWKVAAKVFEPTPLL